jgi:hypothetical protein
MLHDHEKEQSLCLREKDCEKREGGPGEEDGREKDSPAEVETWAVRYIRNRVGSGETYWSN